MKVLVADDHLVNRKMMMMLVSALGHQVDLAEDGRRACEMAADGVYDLIFMDIHMPVMDGLEAMTAIRKLPGVTPRLVVVTADDSEETQQKALSVGADMVQTKPIDVAKLKRVLDLMAR